MSRVYKEISSIDAVPNHIETPNRVIGLETVGKTTFRSKVPSQYSDRLNFQLERNNYLENLANRSLKASSVPNTTLGLQSRLNKDFGVSNPGPNLVTSKIFGLQAKNYLASSTQTTSHLRSNLNLNQDIANVHSKSTMPTRFRTFDLMSDNLSSVNIEDNEILNSESRRNESMSSSVMSRPFGLQTKNLTLNSDFFSGNDLRGNMGLYVMNYRKSNTEKLTLPRTLGLGSEKTGDNLGANVTEGFIRDLRKNGNFNSSMMSRPLGHQSKSFATHSSFLAEGSSRLNQDINYRSNNLTTAFQTFRPLVRCSALTTESQTQNSSKHGSKVIDNDGFRRPTLSRVIKGRNSVMSSRLFGDQSVERHCRDLSNVNGFNISHISEKNVDTLSESRLAVHRKRNWMDSQSMVSSAVSGASMKAQFINLLENLHHSILNIGPHLSVEAVRMEFDKAKQGLENINEISFAPSIRELDTASVISHSSNFNCPTINESATLNVIDGGSLILKSSKEVLKTLFSNKTHQKSKLNLSAHVEEGGKRKDKSRTFEVDSNNEDVSESLFKKPKPYFKKRESLKNVKVEAYKTGKSLISEKGSKIISLKEWYPVAFGSDLAFCGINEEGVTVETDPMRKRLNCRKVELINGLCCNLIGSPSAMVSVLPEKVAKLLKNGVTDRWRVLQKELLNCQGAIKEPRKNSPATVSSPKKTMPKTPERKAVKAKPRNPKIVSSPRNLKKKSPSSRKKKSNDPKVEISPKKSRNAKEVLTRSGRTVKPPTMFWLVVGREEVSPLPASITPKKSSRKSYKISDDEIPAKKLKKAVVGSPKKECKKGDDDSVTEKMNVSSHVSPPKSKTIGDESSCKKSMCKPPMMRTPKKRQQKKSNQETTVYSSKVDEKRQNKTRETCVKRKREVAGDNDSIQTKKSKLEKKVEVEVKSTTPETEPISKKERKKRGRIARNASSPEAKAKKSPVKKSKKKTMRGTESDRKKERNDSNEFEEDFELQLHDIEIPEITNVSGNPKLNRSQLRVVSMETPPLKYFNSNLRLLGSATPLRSPDWCISQKTESEVKRFQKRREEAFKKKTRVDLKKTVVTKKTTKTVHNKDLKRVMEWVTEKTVKSPVWNSRVLKYVIPSRRQKEQQDDEVEEDEDIETEFC